MAFALRYAFRFTILKNTIPVRLHLTSRRIPCFNSIEGLTRLQGYYWSRHCSQAALAKEPSLAFERDIAENVGSLGPKLPKTCPGCGALASGPDAEVNAGCYDFNRKTVKGFLAQEMRLNTRQNAETTTFDRIATSATPSLREELGIGGLNVASEGLEEPSLLERLPLPVCNRCHQLLHHSKGQSIVHPSLQSINQMISESPYSYNHIYHVLDAADFPLSLIPQLQQRLQLSPQRSVNRRAKHHKFYKGREAEMSFIITRSDLLAPQKEQVDSLMPYLIQVLRDALNSSNRDIRLGNVRCVSAKRGWWTKQIKEDIWYRGGGGWMVGKVNVGKSNLLECIYPKARQPGLDAQPSPQSREISTILKEPTSHSDNGLPDGTRPNMGIPIHKTMGDKHAFDEHLLLPPVQPEQSFPVLPIVSDLPGTTASPIRLPFGGGKGELIDLPGLPRGSLEDFVTEDCRSEIFMHHRVIPKQFVIKPGKSLLLGGLVRITPTSPDLTILVYPFVTLKPHITSVEKGIAIHTQSDDMTGGVPTIAKPGIGTKMASAGTFTLSWNVTRQRSGPLVAPAAAGLKPQNLPFVVLATDILIEGCGWVEIVAQVRRKDLEANADDFNQTSRYPKIEVWSPNGDYIAARRPMNGWMLGRAKSEASSRRTIRPRRSMKGAKKRLKQASS